MFTHLHDYAIELDFSITLWNDFICVVQVGLGNNENEILLVLTLFTFSVN